VRRAGRADHRAAARPRLRRTPAYLRARRRPRTPDEGASLPTGLARVTGYAFAGGGDRTVSRVDVSRDGGQTWIQAIVDDPPGPWAWQLWHTALDLPAGAGEITVRAWDDTGASQPESPTHLWNPRGYVNNSWARVRVDVY
jgi:sulfite oxidase